MITIQVRMRTFTITDQDRRAIRFVTDGRKTMCSRDEAKEWIDGVVNRALRDLRYRWHGPQADEAILAGADPEGLASHEPRNGTPASAQPQAQGNLQSASA